MKKLIAISVVFALVTAVAFAQPSVGGALGAKVVIVASDSTDDAPLVGGMGFTNRHVNVDYANGDGTAGGRVRLYAAGATGWWGALPFAFGWWKPIPQLRVQIGHNPDGDLGAAQITGWGMNAEAQDSVAIDNDSDGSGYGSIWKNGRSQGYYGGFSQFGVLLSLYPADGLNVNLVLPYGTGRNENPGANVGEIYSKFHLNVVYSIPDVGVLRITFQGLGGLADNDDYPQKVSAGDIFASFFVTAVDNLALDFGVKFGLPYEDASGVDQSPGLGIGVGLRFTSGDFGVRARVGAALGSEAGDVAGPTNIGLTILPSFVLPAFTFYFNAGFGVSIPDDKDADASVDWFINPYIRKSVSNFSFYAGFKLGAPAAVGDDDPVVKWAIPIGFNSYF
jgi:hypothetical protein